MGECRHPDPVPADGPPQRPRDQLDWSSPELLRKITPEIFHDPLVRCLDGVPPEAQGRLTDDDVKTFFLVRADPEPLYYWASDLAFSGHPGPALRLLREAVRRGYCLYPAIELDPTFNALTCRIRGDRGRRPRLR